MAARPPRVADDVSEVLEVEYLLSAAGRARRALAESMAGQEVDPQVVEEARLVVSELVTNAVQHVRPPTGAVIRVAWTLRKGVIELAVTDSGGDTEPVAARRHVLADSGRGLRIVRSLSHEWGVVDHGRGRTVWAALGGPSRRRTR